MSQISEKKILVVDDNPINRDVLTTFLIAKGYLVEEAVNGMDALELVKGKSFDLILMDLLLPVLDGFETVREMRRSGVSTPIVAQSSLSFKQDQQRSLEAGCNDFLPKPIRFNELIRMVEKYTFIPPSEGNGCSTPLIRPESPVSGKKMLLVEEDNELAHRYTSVLEGLGLRVDQVRNGTEAWEAIQLPESEFDLVLSNIFTSGIDGLGLLAMVKRQYPAKMVFLYAPDDGHDMYQLALRLGADGILPRSRVESAIAGVIESAVRRSSHSSSWDRDAATARQVRQSQLELNRFGRRDGQENVDVASITLHDAGGDMAFSCQFNLAGRYGAIVIDVAGHDVISSYISAVSLGILSSTWDKLHEPMELLISMNSELMKLGSDRYHICVTSLLWDQRRNRIKMAVAGNPGGLLVRRNDDGELEFRELEGGGMCLGAFRRSDLFVFHEIEFIEGEYLFLFSDGMDAGQVREAILRDGNTLERESAQGLSGEILNRILSRHQQTDDMILLALRAPARFPKTGEHLYFSARYDDVDRACEWVAEILDSRPLPAGHDVDFVNLAIREALLNAVEHGNAGNPNAPMDISLYFETGRVRVDISDEGQGFDLPGRLAQIREQDRFSIGKRGLLLMDAATDGIEVNGGTVTLLFKDKTAKGAG